MYNEVFVRLLIAAVITFVVILAAAYWYVLPLGQRSPRAVVPVLGTFMEAAASRDLLRARLTWSADLLQPPRSATADAMLAQSTLFDGYEGLELTSFQLLPQDQAGGRELAAVEALIRYRDGRRARLDAVLELEATEWRINDFLLTPYATGP